MRSIQGGGLGALWACLATAAASLGLRLGEAVGAQAGADVGGDLRLHLLHGGVGGGILLEVEAAALPRAVGKGGGEGGCAEASWASLTARCRWGWYARLERRGTRASGPPPRKYRTPRMLQPEPSSRTATYQHRAPARHWPATRTSS
ncbi:MAG: hypothetical protein R3F11_02560 [Verrucomicrobiales bacterium]